MINMDVEQIFSQDFLDKKNAEFWNELCGSHLAKTIGLNGNDPDSLKKFDRVFFDIYPYLYKYLKAEKFQGKRVLEIGLGYGTVGQYLSSLGADYVGMDIADSPVQMMNERLRYIGKPPSAKVGNMLSCPFPAQSFDCVVSIGCFHHTGNVKRCCEETYRILKPGGYALIMVYNHFGLRQWQSDFKGTLNSWITEVFGNSSELRMKDDESKRPYDANHLGETAPEIVLSSTRTMHQYLKLFSKVKIYKENADNHVIYKKIHIPRSFFLNNLAKIFGLDLYIECYKK